MKFKVDTLKNHQWCQLGGGNLVRTFIRTVMSLVREQSGTVMCVREWDRRVGTGDESGEVLVWDWSNNSMVRVVTLVRLVGTVMSLAWDME